MRWEVASVVTTLANPWLRGPPARRHSASAAALLLGATSRPLLLAAGCPAFWITLLLLASLVIHQMRIGGLVLGHQAGATGGLWTTVGPVDRTSPVMAFHSTNRRSSPVPTCWR